MTELEKMQRAKMYIDKLANGVDPLTDKEVNDDSVLNQVRISRCLFYVSEILAKVIDNGGEVGKRAVVKELPFTVTEEQLAQVEITEDAVGVSVIAMRINAVLNDGVRHIPATHISGWLAAHGYLQENTYANKKAKVTTERGEALGIFTVEGVSSKGITYRKNIYSAQAQRFIIENAAKIEAEMNQRS